MRDVLPGCTSYTGNYAKRRSLFSCVLTGFALVFGSVLTALAAQRRWVCTGAGSSQIGSSDWPWGAMCSTAIADFDLNHSLPQNVGTADHPVYHFAPASPRDYVLYIPPSGNLPISAQAGRYEYFLFQYLKSKGVGVFVVQVPTPGSDLWDHVPAYSRVGSPYGYNCSQITYEQPPQPAGLHDLCVKNRSTAIIEAAIDHAKALGYRSQPTVMGWSSGGAMASAFVSYVHTRASGSRLGTRSSFATERGTRFTIKGLALLSSGSQYCYAYDHARLPLLVKNDHWSNCTSQKQPYGTRFGCCPSGLTEEFFYRYPEEYSRHPPTLLVQSRADCNSDTDAALYYHQTMTKHAARSSTHFVVAGQCHDVSPPMLGVIVSWLNNLLGTNATAY